MVAFNFLGTAGDPKILVRHLPLSAQVQQPPAVGWHLRLQG